MRLLLLGAPGAGKGTQGKVIAERNSIPVIATGDMLRAAVEKGTPLGQKANEYMTRGDLVPDDVIIDMVEERLSQTDAANGFLLDGFPRTVAQADALGEMLTRNGWPLNAVVAIEVSDEELVKRLAGRATCTKCGTIYHLVTSPPTHDGVCDNCGSQLHVREDDKPEAVRQRLVVYKEKTAPVVEYYRASGLLKIVNGEQPPEQVTLDIEAAVS